MTGRDLIIYILKNSLEDEPIFKNGRFIGFLTIGEVAEKEEVGIATIHTWINQKKLPYISVKGVIYIPADFKSPKER